MLSRKLTGPEYQYADVPIQLVKSETEENRYELSIQGSTRPVAHQCSAEIGEIDYDGRWNLSSPYATYLGYVVKDSASGAWVVQNKVKQTMTRVGTSLRDEEFEAVVKLAREKTEAISKYPTLSEFPVVPDFGAIYGVSMYKSPLFDNPDWHNSYVSFDYDAKSVDARAEALFGSSATVFDMFKDYAGILKACGFKEKSAKSISGDPLTVYEKDGHTVQLFNASFNHGTYGYWQSPTYTVMVYFSKR